MTAGKKFLMLESFDESLTEEYVDAARAKDGKMFPKKPEQPYGKGDKLSTPQKDVKAKPDTYAAAPLSDGEVGLIMVGLVGAGMMVACPDASAAPGSLAPWRCPSYAYEKVVSILSGLGLEPEAPPEADAFGKEKTSYTVKVCRHVTQDYDQDSDPAGTHTSITLSWVEKQPAQFEVSAEISGKSSSESEGG